MSKMAKVKSCRGCPGFQDCGTAYINGNGFYKTHPDCPLPDYVDVIKLQKERDELAKLVDDIANAYKRRDRGYSDYNTGYHDALIDISDNVDEAFAKIKGEI